MNNNNTYEIAERFKTAQEFAQDYAAYCNCRGVVHNYNRCNAICLLNALLQRYKSEINEFGFIFDGVHVISRNTLPNIYQFVNDLNISYVIVINTAYNMNAIKNKPKFINFRFISLDQRV